MAMSIASASGGAQVKKSYTASALEQVGKIGSGIGSLITSIGQAVRPAKMRDSHPFKSGDCIAGLRKQISETFQDIAETQKRKADLENKMGDESKKHLRLMGLGVCLDQFEKGDRKKSCVVLNSKGLLVLSPSEGLRKMRVLFGEARAVKMLKRYGIDLRAIQEGAEWSGSLSDAVSKELGNASASYWRCNDDITEASASIDRLIETKTKAQKALRDERALADTYQLQYRVLQKQLRAEQAVVEALSGLSGVLHRVAMKGPDCIESGHVAYCGKDGGWRIDAEPRKGAAAKREYAKADRMLKKYKVDDGRGPDSKSPSIRTISVLHERVAGMVNSAVSSAENIEGWMNFYAQEWSGRKDVTQLYANLHVGAVLLEGESSDHGHVVEDDGQVRGDHPEADTVSIDTGSISSYYSSGEDPDSSHGDGDDVSRSGSQEIPGFHPPSITGHRNEEDVGASQSRMHGAGGSSSWVFNGTDDDLTAANGDTLATVVPPVDDVPRTSMSKQRAGLDRSLGIAALSDAANAPRTRFLTVAGRDGHSLPDLINAARANLVVTGKNGSGRTASPATGSSATGSRTHVPSSNGASHQSGAGTIGATEGNNARVDAKTSSAGSRKFGYDFYRSALAKPAGNPGSRSSAGSEAVSHSRVDGSGMNANAGSSDAEHPRAVELALWKGLKDTLKSATHGENDNVYLQYDEGKGTWKINSEGESLVPVSAAHHAAIRLLVDYGIVDYEQSFEHEPPLFNFGALGRYVDKRIPELAGEIDDHAREPRADAQREESRTSSTQASMKPAGIETGLGNASHATPADEGATPLGGNHSASETPSSSMARAPWFETLGRNEKVADSGARQTRTRFVTSDGSASPLGGKPAAAPDFETGMAETPSSETASRRVDGSEPARGQSRTRFEHLVRAAGANRASIDTATFAMEPSTTVSNALTSPRRRAPQTLAARTIGATHGNNVRDRSTMSLTGFTYQTPSHFTMPFRKAAENPASRSSAGFGPTSQPHSDGLGANPNASAAEKEIEEFIHLASPEINHYQDAEDARMERDRINEKIADLDRLRGMLIAVMKQDGGSGVGRYVGYRAETKVWIISSPHNDFGGKSNLYAGAEKRLQECGVAVVDWSESDVPLRQDMRKLAGDVGRRIESLEGELEALKPTLMAGPPSLGTASKSEDGSEPARRRPRPRFETIKANRNENLGDARIS